MSICIFKEYPVLVPVCLSLRKEALLTWLGAKMSRTFLGEHCLFAGWLLFTTAVCLTSPTPYGFGSSAISSRKLSLITTNSTSKAFLFISIRAITLFSWNVLFCEFGSNLAVQSLKTEMMLYVCLCFSCSIHSAWHRGNTQLVFLLTLFFVFVFAHDEVSKRC